MGLIGNHSVLNKSFQRTYGGSTLAIANHMNNKSSLMSTNILRQRGQLQFKKASIPTGYGGGSAIMIPWSTGELGVQRVNGVATITATALSALISSPIAITGAATVVGNANAIGLLVLAGTSAGVGALTGNASAAASMSASIAGLASITANLGAIIPVFATSSGVASSSVNLKGVGRLNGVITIGASGYLSNDDVSRLAIAVWDEPIADHLDVGTTGKALSDASGGGGGGGATAAEIAIAVWDEPTASHVTAGTMGEAMGNAGTAANPWSAAIIDNNDPGTFGNLVQKLLTLGKFLGLK